MEEVREGTGDGSESEASEFDVDEEASGLFPKIRRCSGEEGQQVAASRGGAFSCLPWRMTLMQYYRAAGTVRSYDVRLSSEIGDDSKQQASWREAKPA